MKKFYILSLLSILIGFQSLKAQTEQFSVGELNPYFSEYMNPFAQAMASSMSGGWTHTASVHSTLGFDITISASGAMVPSSNFTFDPTSLNMPNYSFSNSVAPTISADNGTAVPNISRSFTNNVPDLTFEGMKGLSISYGGMPSIQAGIGLPKGTEIMVRFIPDISGATNTLIPESVDISLEKTGMWGVGVKHDIKQWIPVISKVPFLQMSGLFNYSQMYTGFSGGAFLIDPARLGATSTLDESTWENQKMDIKMSSFNGSLLIGASIPVFQPFIGIGFSTNNFDGGLYGNYPIVTADPGDLANPYKVTESETDPILVETKITDFNFQAGARLKFGPFVFFYAWAKQTYSIHTGGLALTFR